MTTLVYQELLQLADGRTTTVERKTDVPDGHVVWQNMGADAYLPLDGVRLPHGGYWHRPDGQDGDFHRIRLLPAAEVKALAKRGTITTTAVIAPDPITGIDLTDLQEADGFIPQVAGAELLAEIEA